MKKLLLILLTAVLSYSGFAQGDAAVGAFYLTDAGSGPNGPAVNPNALSTNTVYTLNLPIFNAFGNAIPSGATTISISVGANMQFVNTTPDAGTAAGLFSWTINNSGTPTAVGSQIASIPGYFDGVLSFQVRVVGQTPSSGSVDIVNWGINTGTGYTDIGTQNNDAQMTYFTGTVLPVKFTGLEVNTSNCTVNVTWNVAEEVNVDRYEVLVSTTGANFRAVANRPQSSVNGGAYNASFAVPADMKGQVLFVQVREVDKDGKVTLSNVKRVSGNCDGNNRPLVVYAYPNPVTTSSFITVGAKEGVFNGKYRLELVDNNGKLYQVKEVSLNNQVSVPFEFNQALSPGRYLIRVSNLNGSEKSTVQFIKVGGVL